MIWIDGFYLSLFGIVAMGLFETILIHSLLRFDRAVLAVSIDAVFRKLMPMCVYPCIMTSAFLAGNNQFIIAIAVSVGGISIFSGLGALQAYNRIRLIAQKRKNAIKKLLKCQIDEEAFDEDEKQALMQNAFNVFDLDNSGQLDRKEMRLILNTMYPKMRGKHQLAAMKAVGSDEVSFEDFHEAVTTWNKIAGQAPPEAVKRSGSSIMDRFRRKKPEVKSKGLKALQQHVGGGGGAGALLKAWGKAAEDTKTKDNIKKAAGLATSADERAKKAGSAAPGPSQACPPPNLRLGSAGAFAKALAKAGDGGAAPAAAPSASSDPKWSAKDKFSA